MDGFARVSCILRDFARGLCKALQEPRSGRARLSGRSVSWVHGLGPRGAMTQTRAHVRALRFETSEYDDPQVPKVWPSTWRTKV